MRFHPEHMQVFLALKIDKPVSQIFCVLLNVNTEALHNDDPKVIWAEQERKVVNVRKSNGLYKRMDFCWSHPCISVQF